jgi:predicted RNA methylase
MADKKVKLGNTRVTGKEQYYTPSDLSREILERVCLQIDNPKKRVFLEPAGGTGSFIEAAKAYGFKQIVSMDIEPKHELVQEMDFLESQLDVSSAVCVTNPPFGRNNSLSVPFFNKAAEYSDIIAFIVPRSWRKWSVLNRLNMSFHLVDDWNLDIDYVDDEGESTHGVGNLRTCVQVWKKDESKLRLPVKIPDHGIIEKTTPELADVSFTLFGYGCGTVKEDFPRVPNTTQTFLKLKHPRALEALNAVDFSRFFNHTAYTEALGLQEINYLLNDYLGLETMKYSTDPLNENYLGLNHAEQLASGDQPRIF